MGSDPEKIAVIGLGAMARALIAALRARPAGLRVGAALVTSQGAGSLADGIARFTSRDALLGWGPSLVVECAGHAAVAEHVPPLLAAGTPVILASIGALADPALRLRVAQATEAGGSLTLVPGAMGGLDVLRAARLAGLDSVVYCGTKPPSAWRGSHAETLVDLDAIEQPTTFFAGTAALAAQLFPKNANVCAAVALDGIGFDNTQVQLVADPQALANRHSVTASGAFGRFEIVLDNAPLPDNPRTSWLAALSVEAAVRQHFAPTPF